MDKPPSLYISALGAFISNSFSTILQAPFFRCGAILQTQGVISKIHTPYKGIIHCMRSLIKNEGFISLWRGNFPAILRFIPARTVEWTLHDILKNTIQYLNFGPRPVQLIAKNFVAAGLSGGLVSIFSYPFDLIRVRLATDMGKDLKKRKFSGLSSCIEQLYMKSGILGLYRGFGVALFGIVLYRSTYFGFYNSLSPSIVVRGIPDESVMFKKFVIAQFATIFATFCTYPFDTVKKRLMMQSDPGEITYTGTLDCIKKMIKTEGIRSLYRGCLFRYTVGIGTPIALVIYENVKTKLENDLKDNI